MSARPTSDPPAPPGLDADRVIGLARGPAPGPTLICLGAVHGNEPAGVLAARRVLRELTGVAGLRRGELLALVGNRVALGAGRRYIHRDLNRGWTRDRRRFEERRVGESGSAEDREHAELLAEIEAAVDRARGEVYIVDLHTTSGPSAPFLLIGDTLRNRRFARQFPLPIILGLEEHLDGTIAEYLTEHGHVTLSVEAGQHGSEGAVDNAAAALWIALAAAGLVDGPAHAAVRRAHAHLAHATRALPGVLEVVYRHAVAAPAPRAFAMKPGFHNFARISPGDPLATDQGSEIRSRWDARLLMPLYQDLGDDGFFVVRQVRPFWLRVSGALRRLHVDRLIHLLPGVRRHPERTGTLVVNRRIARWQTLRLLHLLGFRKLRDVGGVLLVSRRRHDLSREAPD